MKIRDKLIIIAVLPIVLVLNLGVVQYRNTIVIARLNDKAQLADDISKKLSLLNELTLEHRVYSEERINVQWMERHTDIGKQLETVAPLFSDNKEKNTLDLIKRGHRTLLYLFAQLSAHGFHDREKSARSRQFADRITSRLLQEMEIIMAEVERLHSINHDSSVAYAERQSRLFIVFLVILALAVPSTAFFIIRAFSGSLTALQKGMQAVASGNLEYRIKSTSRDEVGDVSRAFDTMAEQRLRAEQARRESERILVHQSRLAAMGEMINAIAHQWRQPLNAVNAIIQDLKDAREYGVLDRTYLDRSVKNAMQQIQFMSRTIDDFRDFFHPDKTKKSFDVKQAAAEVLTMVSSQLLTYRISYRITCHVHNRTFEDFTSPIIPCEEMMILGYENEMKQVFLNLVNNAKDAILECREHGLMGPGVKGMIAIDFELPGERVVIKVTDNGGGIPAGILDRIFEPYFSTKEPGQGTGIGLYMSKVIIENNMGGRLTARNVDGGAEFRIEV
ncbi:MAG: HAMP domain-containing histidine kinase [Nitrospirae bacterium]|nr:HAMP domain-containing histidine kinase [Nitrospirota bacterium]